MATHSKEASISQPMTAQGHEVAKLILTTYATKDPTGVGQKHVYGIDGNGKKRSLSHDAVLDHFLGEIDENGIRPYEATSEANVTDIHDARAKRAMGAKQDDELPLRSVGAKAATSNIYPTKAAGNTGPALRPSILGHRTFFNKQGSGKTKETPSEQRLIDQYDASLFGWVETVNGTPERDEANSAIGTAFDEVVSHYGFSESKVKLKLFERRVELSLGEIANDRAGRPRYEGLEAEVMDLEHAANKIYLPSLYRALRYAHIAPRKSRGKARKTLSNLVEEYFIMADPEQLESPEEVTALYHRAIDYHERQRDLADAIVQEGEEQKALEIASAPPVRKSFKAGIQEALQNTQYKFFGPEGRRKRVIAGAGLVTMLGASVFGALSIGQSSEKGELRLAAATAKATLETNALTGKAEVPATTVTPASSPAETAPSTTTVTTQLAETGSTINEPEDDHDPSGDPEDDTLTEAEKAAEAADDTEANKVNASTDTAKPQAEVPAAASTSSNTVANSVQVTIDGQRDDAGNRWLWHHLEQQIGDKANTGKIKDGDKAGQAVVAKAVADTVAKNAGRTSGSINISKTTIDAGAQDLIAQRNL